MTTRTMMQTGWSLIVVLFLAACGGGGSPGEGSPPGNGSNTNTPAAALIAGYDFTLSEGAFWEYGWRAHGSSYAMSDTRNYDYGAEFRVTLGAPTTILGVTAYPMLISGQPHTTDAHLPDAHFVHDRWTHIAMSSNKIYASRDGQTLTEVFDAQDGKMLGSGFFQQFGSYLQAIKPGYIDNGFIKGDTHIVEISGSEGECEYFPEVGQICGGGMAISYKQREHYQPGIGPVGYLYSNSYSSCGGGFCSGASDYLDIGLVASSFRGDAISRLLEQEPNNAPANAHVLSLPTTVRGGFFGESEYGPTTTYVTLNTTPEQEPNNCVGSGCTPQALLVPVRISGTVAAGTDACQVVTGIFNPNPCIADWYQFTAPVSTTPNSNLVVLEVSLKFSGSVAADLDLFVFRASDGVLVSYSAKDNLTSTSYMETTTFSATAGATYYVGVAGYAPQSTRINYTLDVNNFGQSIDVAPTDWYQFDINSYNQLVISLAGDADAVVLVNAADKVVHYHYKRNGDLVTDLLSPGTYRLGVHAKILMGNYDLSINPR